MLKPGYGSTPLTSGHLPQVCVLSTRVVFQQGRSTLLCLHRRLTVQADQRLTAVQKLAPDLIRGSRSSTPRPLLINFGFSILRLSCPESIEGRFWILILLKNLRSSFESLRTNGEAVEIMGDFSVHAERVEAFLGFFSIIRFWIPTLPFLFRVLIRRYDSGQFSCFEVAPAVRQ